MGSDLRDGVAALVMAPAPRRASEAIEPPSGGLDPALLRIIEAMARADARRDFQAARLAPLPSAGCASHD